MACIPFLAGCFYLGPPWTVLVNISPDIVMQMPPDTVVLTSEQQMVWVQVHDDDVDDILTIYWWVDEQLVETPDRVYTWQDETGLWNSRLRIGTATERHGSHITCLFTDGEAQGQTDWEVIRP